MISAIKHIFRIGTIQSRAIYPFNDDHDDDNDHDPIEVVVINDWEKGYDDRIFGTQEEITLYQAGEQRSVDLSHSIMNPQHQPYSYEEHTRQMARRMERIERQRKIEQSQSFFFEPPVNHESESSDTRGPSVRLSDRAQIYAAWSIAGTP